MQVDDHIKVRLFSQLMAFQEFQESENYLKCFNCTIISTSFVLPLAGVFSGLIIVDLNDSEPAKLLFCSSL